MWAQHGDVGIKSVSAIPSNAKEVKNGIHVLMQGSSNGNSHVVKDTVNSKLFVDGETKYLQVTSPVEVTHEEHKAGTLPIGLYQVFSIMEYNHFEEEAQAVKD